MAILKGAVGLALIQHGRMEALAAGWNMLFFNIQRCRLAIWHGRHDGHEVVEITRHRCMMYLL
jgi:hypothetical protein